MEAPILKQLASGIAFVLTFLLFLPYIRSIWRGTVVPHAFSWVIWAFGTFVVFLAQLADGGGMGAWPIGFSACVTAYIAFLSFRMRVHVDITRLDWVLLVLAFAAIPGWVVASDPFWAVLFLTTADLIGFGPTIRKAYTFPHQEHIGFFALGAIRNSFVLLALEHYSWTTALFPAAVGVACVFAVSFLLARRAIVPAAAQDESSAKIAGQRVLE